jgi:hypothetical protein
MYGVQFITRTGPPEADRFINGKVDQQGRIHVLVGPYRAPIHLGAEKYWTRSLSFLISYLP